MSLRSPLGRARGLGSAKSGLHHWIAQRLTAIALVPLSLWFIVTLVCLIGSDHATAVERLQSPLTATLLILFIAALFHHAQLGVQVVIEDYVHGHWQKLTSLVVVKFIAVFAALASIIAVLKVSLGL
ncbi:succinate dehydrogenase / fumarate reductase membrane anchor subunit [Methylohalomonas lacus]|uniref:Succinate dehydrogenase hydrophobic membrane anchor subunit n=1 Tax=Methylohalomonas lacus TaxID=398773 RepID=A0AAE3L0F7_9GAMM|nr:succinate dehydrogenase, hydrophobic membrane anchor protein [Methylohalomonas lacus]MCS3902424.1 succinate dehydrogenase / fumarate reductase membrane anchor subunit [Methylohalomonas lacus]